MNFRTISYLLGRLFCIVAVSMAVPAYVSYRYNEIFQLHAFYKSIAVTLIIGGLMMYINRKYKNDLIRTRDGFLLVTLTWFFMSIFGALPFYWSGFFNGFVDCFFESASGFTTTGASVLTDIEALPYGLLFWRSLTQWIGGLGIVVLAVAILPQLSVGGMQLMKNEMPGPTFEQLKPRIRQTAISLWKIYVLFSVVLLVILYSLGMPVFDSFCHVFSTLSTGGFSTQNNSIAGYSTEIQMVMSFFMFLGGCNFVLHYAWLHGDFKTLFKNEEFRFFVTFLTVVILAISVDLIFRIHVSVLEAFRLTIFQVASMASSTGFATTDFNQWPALSKGIIFLLMFVGGCAG
ncbi:MAG: TrkH family potassium uptake protein, partial [Candidatus Omnitrophica bacterium]|nr:TrkH family potassium uptake protein [Candidatus Omnitrophota bacterium]